MKLHLPEPWFRYADYGLIQLTCLVRSVHCEFVFSAPYASCSYEKQFWFLLKKTCRTLIFCVRYSLQFCRLLPRFWRNELRSSTLKECPIYYSGALITTYKTALHLDLEDYNPLFHNCENLRSHVIVSVSLSYHFTAFHCGKLHILATTTVPYKLVHVRACASSGG